MSLRDVERVLQVMVWFYNHKEHLYDKMDELEEKKLKEDRPNLLQNEEARKNLEEGEERPVKVSIAG